MKKARLVFLNIVLLGSLIFPLRGTTLAIEEIKIGMVLPLTGPLASVGAQVKAGAEVAVTEINSDGGIKSMGGAKIKLIFGDSMSNPEGGVAETERLITREKVSLMMGAYQSAVTFPATEVAQRYKCPWYVNIAFKEEITERGYNYVFRECGKTSYDVVELIKAIDYFSKETGKRPKNFALLYEGTDWGRSEAEFTKKLFPEAGYKMVADESVPTSHVDFTAQILKLKSIKPDILVLALYTPTNIIFNKQMLAQKLYFPYGLWSYGGGPEDPTFYKALPTEAVEYMFVQDDNDVLASNRAWYPELNDKIKAKLGYGINTSTYAGYGPMYVVKDVLERCASADRDKIRDAIAETDISLQNCGRLERKSGGQTFCPPLIRGIERIKFDKQGQNSFSHGMITQNQKGQKVPLHVITIGAEIRPKGAKLFWPIPPYDQR